MAQPASRTGQTRSQTQRNTWWPFFCNQRTRINKAWRDDCTNSKTGGMSTKLGRQSQEIKPKFDQTFADQPPHPDSTWMCPKRPGTGIPAILDDLMEATPKKTPVSSPNVCGLTSHEARDWDSSDIGRFGVGDQYLHRRRR